MTQTEETLRSPKLAARYELAEQLKKDGERVDELQRNEYLIFQHPGVTMICFTIKFWGKSVLRFMKSSVRQQTLGVSIKQRFWTF